MKPFIPLFFVLSILGTASCFAGNPPLDEGQALQVLEDRLEADNVYPDGCTQIHSETLDSNAPHSIELFEFAVREKHGGDCPGDPETSPIRDRFAVDASGQVLWNDFATGDYVVYEERQKSLAELTD